MQLDLNIIDETSLLEAVVLGIGQGFGGQPSLSEAYDPKSKEHISMGTFPLEKDIINEINAFQNVLEKYKVKVYRPDIIPSYNQIFPRDIAFVIDQYFIIPNIIQERSKEYSALSYIVNQINPKHIIKMPFEAKVEDGDVMPIGEYIFVGVSSEEDFNKYRVTRTNYAGVRFLQKIFPLKKIVSFELNKSHKEPRDNALHLDCCFQYIGKGQAIIYSEGFKYQDDVQFLLDYFGQENLIEITREEMYNMNCNIFSISPEVIVSEKGFTRLNGILREKGFVVEEIPYAEISKMEGLLRCSTLPLRRKRDE